jgi:S-layer protein (TIGR01567 family)
VLTKEQYIKIVMGWRRVMNHMKVGGICVLIILIMGILPIGVFAENESEVSSSTDEIAPITGAETGTSEETQAEDTETGPVEETVPEGIEAETPEETEAEALETETPEETGAEVTEAETAEETEAEVTEAETAEETEAEVTEAETPEETEAEVTEAETAEETGAEVTEAETPEETGAEVTEAETAEETGAEALEAETPEETEAEALEAETPEETAAEVTEAETPEETAAEITEAELEPEVIATNAEVEPQEEVIEEIPEVELISSGDRIWREGICADTYTWTPQTFSGFFYDLDEEVGTEELTIYLQKSGDQYDKSIDSGQLKYTTETEAITYEFDDWGTYDVIGFMAEKYFAGYVDTDRAVVSGQISLINEGELRKVLIDSDEDRTITTGSVLPLEEGYELRIKEIDLEGNKVWLAIAKDGDEVDDQVVVPGDLGSSTYTYEVEIGGEDTPLVLAHISTVFAGAETSLATVDGLFQISDSYTSVEDGDKYGKMEVSSVSDVGIEMENENSISLKRGNTVSIMGDISFEVADASVLRFAPIVKKTGSYEIRGTVVNPTLTDNFEWTPYNFEGFYYDIDEDVGGERLKVLISGTSIDESDLEYETEPQPVDFEFSEWGKYDVIGFMAEKYFAGFNSDTDFTDEFSVINEGELRKILMDDDSSHTVLGGTALPLKEGYEIRIKEVDLEGNKVWLALTIDGEEVDDQVIVPGSSVESSTYTYEVRIGSEDVPIVAVHIENVFRGREADLLSIKGIFQVSDEPESVEEGEKHGKMEVDTLSDMGIGMVNSNSVSLGRGKTIEIMGDLKLKVADNENRDFFPVVEIKGDMRPLRLNIPEATVGLPSNLKVTSNGETIAGAYVLVDGDEIGTTDEEGIIEYLPKEAGTFDVEAKKSEYGDAKSTIIVAAAIEERKLAIRVPPEVLKDEDFLITVTIGLNQTGVEGAKILFDETEIGLSDDRGGLTYSSNVTGEHSIMATKEGYEDGTKKIIVLSPVQVKNIDLKETATAGKTIKITANVDNVGSTSDTRSLALKVNGETVETKDATIAAGESSEVTFEYKPTEPGVYNVEIDGSQASMTVEEAKSNTLLIALIIVVIFAIGGGIYLYKTGELESLRRRLQGR